MHEPGTRRVRVQLELHLQESEQRGEKQMDGLRLCSSRCVILPAEQITGSTR